MSPGGSPGATAWSTARRRAAAIGRGAQVALDALQDRGDRDQLAGGVQVQQLVREGLAALEDREPVTQLVADLDALRVERTGKVGGVHGGLAVLAAAQLVAADGAAVVLADRARAYRATVVVGGLDRPGHLVEDDLPVAGRAAARVAVRDRRLEAGLAAGGGGEGLDSGIEVAEIRRPQHDLGEQPVQRRCSRG